MRNFSTNRLQLTLAILKPDLCRVPENVQGVRNMILNNGFYVLKSRDFQMKQEEAELFYNEHRDKFFFSRLVSFMSSGPISTHILARENAIAEWRKLLGPTKILKAQLEAPDSIRGKYGLTDTRNAAHGSDSEKSAAREILFFFKDFNIDYWLKNEETIYRETSELVEYKHEEGIHVVKTQLQQRIF